MHQLLHVACEHLLLTCDTLIPPAGGRYYRSSKPRLYSPMNCWTSHRQVSTWPKSTWSPGFASVKRLYSTISTLTILQAGTNAVNVLIIDDDPITRGVNKDSILAMSPGPVERRLHLRP